MAGSTSARTLRDYADMAERSFLPRLGEIPVGELTANDVGRWVAWQESPDVQRTGQPLVSKTIRNYQGLLSTILSTAVKNGHLRINPARGASITDSVPREPVFLSPREFGVLLRFIPPYYWLLTNFLAMTRTRWSEATAVEWGDISFDSSPVTLRVNKSWNKGDDGVVRIESPKTTKRCSTISLGPETVAALALLDQMMAVYSSANLRPTGFGTAVFGNPFLRTQRLPPATRRKAPNSICYPSARNQQFTTFVTLTRHG